MACERVVFGAAELLLASFLGLGLRVFLTSKEKYPSSTEESPLELFVNTQFDSVLRGFSTTSNILEESCYFGMTAACLEMECCGTRLGKVDLKASFSFVSTNSAKILRAAKFDCTSQGHSICMFQDPAVFEVALEIL